MFINVAAGFATRWVRKNYSGTEEGPLEADGVNSRVIISSAGALAVDQSNLVEVYS